MTSKVEFWLFFQIFFIVGKLIYYYTDCTKEGKHTIRCGMFYAIRPYKTSKHFRIAGKLHDRIEDNYMITVTDSSACSLQ